MLKRFMSLNLEYPTGMIIGKVKITDCINVDNEFEEKLVVKNELIYGASQDRDGYAFKIEEIKKFDKPINDKGQLGFWNYKK